MRSLRTTNPRLMQTHATSQKPPDSHMWNDPAVKGPLFDLTPYGSVAPICPAFACGRRPLASMTFAIGLAHQINALDKRFGNRGLCLTGMSSRGVIVARVHLALGRRRLTPTNSSKHLRQAIACSVPTFLRMKVPPLVSSAQTIRAVTIRSSRSSAAQDRGDDRLRGGVHIRSRARQPPFSKSLCTSL